MRWIRGPTAPTLSASGHAGVPDSDGAEARLAHQPASTSATGTRQAYVSDEIVSLNPVGSVTSKARLPHGVSCGSESSVTPAALARLAI